MFRENILDKSLIMRPRDPWLKVWKGKSLWNRNFFSLYWIFGGLAYGKLNLTSATSFNWIQMDGTHKVQFFRFCMAHNVEHRNWAWKIRSTHMLYHSNLLGLLFQHCDPDFFSVLIIYEGSDEEFGENWL